MLSNNSLWSSGAGVWLSNGSTAMVRMCDGNAPSEKPYRTPHAATETASSSAAALFKNPNERIECTGRVDAGDGELELSSIGFIAVPNAGPALHPFLYPAVIDPFEAAERVTYEGHAPGDRDTNVGPKRIAVNARRGIGQRRDDEPAESSPEERRRWDQAPREVRSRRREPKLRADQDGSAAPHPASDEEVETNAVGPRTARRTLAAGTDVRILQRPLENGTLVPARELRAWECRGSDGTGERTKSRRAGECHPCDHYGSQGRD